MLVGAGALNRRCECWRGGRFAVGEFPRVGVLFVLLLVADAMIWVMLRRCQWECGNFSIGTWNV